MVARWSVIELWIVSSYLTFSRTKSRSPKKQYKTLFVVTHRSVSLAWFSIHDSQMVSSREY